ncbi:BTAD domain-containing putative transcriptional regulator [Kribbella sp. NPDC051620]|uniref:AfsR/SARP family transcriptional regulator n=1 Tax=Kribbella sp. NPDC051620 TaxID=3364120 RepID=UPI00378DC393
MTQRSGPEPGVSIRLLGTVGIHVDGRPVEIGGERVRALLVVLALAVGEPLPTGVLADRIWGDEPPANIGPSLHTLMTRLRRSVGAGFVVTGPTGYSLRLEPDQVDALRFSRLLRTAAKQTDPQREYAGLLEALALWGGRPFEGVRSDWLEAIETPRLIEQRLGAIERLVDLRPTDAPYAELLLQLRELAAEHPLRESLWARLLRLLAETGRTAEALELYESIRQRIADELGVDPGAELRTIYTELLAGESAEKPVAPNQLPADVPGFTGRKQALAALDRAYCDQGNESTLTIVLHGPGGAGKTSLAVHWGYRVAADFPDGVLFADLGGYGPGEPVDPSVALGYLLHGLGVPTENIQPDVDSRSALLRSTLATRRVLLVLDNARDAEQVRPLLPGSGGTVLITSRSRLRGLVVREGAQQIAVDQLSGVDARALLSERIGVLDADAELLDQLADRCNHLPLALVIAAEQVASRSTAGLEELVQELEHRWLDVLDTGDDPATDLRAVFSWSYRALDPDAARFFRLLGLHPARRFSAAGAAALAGVSDRVAVRLLRRLVDLHLLDETGADRYQLHDLLRAYAGEQVREVDSEEDADAAWRRLLDWAIHSAEAARGAKGEPNRLKYLDAPLPGTQPMQFADRPAAQAWLELELRSLMAIVRAAAARGFHEQAAKLGLQLWAPLAALVSATEAIELQQITAASAELAGDQLVEAMALNQLATSHGVVGDLDQTEALLQRSLEMFLAIDSPAGEALVRGNLGFLYQLRGATDLAVQHLERGLELNRSQGEPHAIATLLINLAMTYVVTGRFAEAVEFATEAAEVGRPLVNQRYLAHAMDTLGQALTGLGRHAEAADRFETSLALHRRDNYLVGVANRLPRLALARYAAGDIERGRAAAAQTRALIAEHGTERLREAGSDLDALLAELDRVEEP